MHTQVPVTLVIREDKKDVGTLASQFGKAKHRNKAGKKARETFHDGGGS